LLYVKEVFSAREVKYNGNQELFVGVCYRTPTENVYGYSIHEKIRKLVCEISIKNFVLFGDLITEA